MKLKMKNGSQRYGINRTSPIHGHKYTKYKMRLSNQHLSNTEAELKKSVAYKKKHVLPFMSSNT